MGEQKKCRKAGRSAAKCARYLSTGRYMRNIIRRRLRHVKAQPGDIAAKSSLMDFAVERGGLAVVQKLKAELAA